MPSGTQNIHQARFMSARLVFGALLASAVIFTGAQVQAAPEGPAKERIPTAQRLHPAEATPAAPKPGLMLLAQNSKRQKQESSGGNFAGRYAILREENKDSGCLLSLNAGGRAVLGPGCRDHGLVVFDPTAWTTARGNIILRARKGHRVTFVPKDGLYVREPAASKPFVLRKF